MPVNPGHNRAPLRVAVNQNALDTFLITALTDAMTTAEPYDYQVDLDIFRGAGRASANSRDTDPTVKRLLGTK